MPKEPSFHPGARLIGNELKKRFDALNERAGNKLVYVFMVFPADLKENASVSSNAAMNEDPQTRQWLADRLMETAARLMAM